jgi:histidinol-phosphatase (PHP family)
MFDMHTHSKNSHDGTVEIDAIAERAKALGMEYIAVTDHLDLDMDGSFKDIRQLDLPAYHNDYVRARTSLERHSSRDASLPIANRTVEYSKVHSCPSDNQSARLTRDCLSSSLDKDIYLAFGLECGYDQRCEADYAEVIRKYPFDVIINSVHVIDGVDPYFGLYFEGKSKDEAYLKYFATVLNSVKANFDYDVIGHISYLSRYALYENVLDYSADTLGIIDAILKEIISHGKCLELNTNVKRVPSLTLPDQKVLRRYFALGGENITFGSDAHQTERIGQNFSAVADLARQIGFKYWTVYKQRKPVKIKI